MKLQPQNLDNILTSHLCFYFTFLISPSVFPLSSLAHFPPAPFSLPSFLVHSYKAFPNVISAVLKISELFFRSLWSTLWSFTLPDTSSPFQDTQDPARLPGSDSPGVNLLGQQDIKSIQHCF